MRKSFTLILILGSVISLFSKVFADSGTMVTEKGEVVYELQEIDDSQISVSSIEVWADNYGKKYSSPNPDSFIEIGGWGNKVIKNNPTVGTWYYLNDGEPNTWYDVTPQGSHVASKVRTNLKRGTLSSWSFDIDFVKGTFFEWNP